MACNDEQVNVIPTLTVTSRNIYLGCAAVFFASLFAVGFFHYFPVGAANELAAIPSIGSLVGALFQISRDSIAHQRTLAVEDFKNRFTVGATSHMADVAFDKHVEFSEAYVAKMEEALRCLYANGPTEQVLPISQELFRIRRGAALWLTPEIENDLEAYETALIRIGHHERLIKNHPDWDDRPKYIKDMFILFSEIVGDATDTRGEPTKGNLATNKIIDGLRTVLGIRELTKLRSELIAQATSKLQDTNPPNKTAKS
jgi:hypothetical protein